VVTGYVSVIRPENRKEEVPSGITILLGCHDVLLLLPQQGEDKHKAPASAPHRTLSLRAGR